MKSNRLDKFAQGSPFEDLQGVLNVLLNWRWCLWWNRLDGSSTLDLASSAQTKKRPSSGQGEAGTAARSVTFYGPCLLWRRMGRRAQSLCEDYMQICLSLSVHWNGSSRPDLQPTGGYKPHGNTGKRSSNYLWESGSWFLNAFGLNCQQSGNTNSQSRKISV